MINTVPPLKIVKDEDGVDLRAHYGLVAQQALLLLWQRKRMIAATVVAALVIAVIALSLIEPRYTSEALIQVNLDLNPDHGAKSQATVSVDAAEVAGTTARIIRSRATADAVVARLGLDKDPRFESRPLFSRWRSGVRAALGLQRSALTPHDLAVDALMRQVRVTAEPRSYLPRPIQNARPNSPMRWQRSICELRSSRNWPQRDPPPNTSWRTPLTFMGRATQAICAPWPRSNS